MFFVIYKLFSKKSVSGSGSGARKFQKKKFCRVAPRPPSGGANTPAPPYKVLKIKHLRKQNGRFAPSRPRPYIWSEAQPLRCAKFWHICRLLSPSPPAAPAPAAPPAQGRREAAEGRNVDFLQKVWSLQNNCLTCTPEGQQVAAQS